MTSLEMRRAWKIPQHEEEEDYNSYDYQLLRLNRDLRKSHLLWSVQLKLAITEVLCDRTATELGHSVA